MLAKVRKSGYKRHKHFAAFPTTCVWASQTSASGEAISCKLLMMSSCSA
jgi:hypothetical protein